MGEDLNPAGVPDADLAELDARINAMILEVATKVRAESAELIRDELVCPCDSFERMEAIPYDNGKLTYAHRTFRASVEFHDICFYGEWSARIVEKGPKQ